MVDTRNASDQVAHNRLFTMLLEVIRPVMVHACRRRNIPGADLDDRLQMASMATLDAVERYDPDRGNFVPFVREVILRQLSNQYRKQTADKRSTLNVSLSLDVEFNPSDGGESNWSLLQTTDTDHRPHLGEARAIDGLSAMLTDNIAQYRRMFWSVLRARLSRLERQVLDGLLRGDSPAETADTINYYALPDTTPARIDTAGVSDVRAKVMNKARRLVRRFCPELVDSLFEAV